MDILPIHFKIFRFYGFWNDPNDSRLIRFFFKLHKIATLMMIFYFTITLIIELVRIGENVEQVLGKLFTVLSYVQLCLVLLHLVFRRKQLFELFDLLEVEISTPQNDEEREIVTRYNRSALKSFYLMMSTLQLTTIFVILTPLMAPKDQRALPFSSYQPYSISNDFLYVLTFSIHVIAAVYGILLNVTFDTMIYCLILKSCAQFDLLFHRLSEIIARRCIEERTALIAKCAKHHILILKFVAGVPELFIEVTGSMLFFILITWCTMIFQLSKTELFDAEFLKLMMYFVCLTYRILSYCWHGNLLTEKNRETCNAIYSSDWTTLTPRERKYLIPFMVISQKELTISYSGICAWNFELFTWIVKSSYAAFRLLQHMYNDQQLNAISEIKLS